MTDPIISGDLDDPTTQSRFSESGNLFVPGTDEEETAQIIALYNPREAIEGWAGGERASGDPDKAALYERALEIQAEWRLPSEPRLALDQPARICPACQILAAAPGDRYCTDCGSAVDRLAWTGMADCE